MAGRGLLYTIGIAINRIVPERLFRFRVTGVYQLRAESAFESDVVVEAVSGEAFLVAEQISGCTRSYRSVATKAEGAYVAWLDRQPVAAIWWADDCFDEPELGLRYELSADARWWFAAKVLPESRGIGVYRSFLTAVLCQNADRTHIAAINPTNKRSIAAHRRFIAKRLVVFVTLRCLRFAICFGGSGLVDGRRWTLDAEARPIVVKPSRGDLLR